MGICFIVAVIGGGIFASSGLLDKPKQNPNDKPKQKQEELLTAHDKATIMIMGVDEREDDVGRSDTLMIATIDPIKDKASLLSIPRDTRVGIRGYGYDKINAAYAYGGEKLTQETVEDFLGLDID
ncbi:MAG TPA: transcriptional regulator, partial [Selenomonas sp.]|nr:transcriptional regulator [Selenomonas sp.]